MFNISYVVVTVKARLAGFDRRLEEAAMDLGANELTTFWKVTFPLILPGIMAAALLAFSLSIDDFVITNFVSGTTNTFPIWVYSIQRNALPVQINVIGSIIFLGAVGPRRRSRSLRSGRAAAHPLTAEADPRWSTPRPPPSLRRGHPRRAAPLPDRSVVPPVWGRITNLVVDRGEGSWLITTDGERYLDYTSGIGVDEHGPRPPAGRRGDPGAGGEAPPRPAEHRLPRAGSAALRAAAGACCPATAGARSCRTAARRRSRRR